MYRDNDTRSEVFHRWLTLIGPEQLLPHISFFLISGYLSRPSDIYKLSIRHLYANPDVSEEEAFGVLGFIEESNNISMGRAIYSLIPAISLEEVKSIISSPCTLAELSDRCNSFLPSKDLLEELYRLSQFGLTFSFNTEDRLFLPPPKSPLTGQVIYLEGPFSAPDDLVTETLTAYGAIIDTEVTETTAYVLSNEPSPDTVKLSAKYKAKIVSEEDMGRILGLIE